jgi:hypothetical protein
MNMSECPINEVLISRIVEIKEMMEDYEHIKSRGNIKGQEAFLREQAKLYEEQFEECIKDLLSKLEQTDKALSALSDPNAFQSSQAAQIFAADRLKELRE